MLGKSEKRLILAVLTGMFFIGMAATDIYISSLPQMVKDFMTVEPKVNLTLSVYFLGIALSVLFVGELAIAMVGVQLSWVAFLYLQLLHLLFQLPTA